MKTSNKTRPRRNNDMPLLFMIMAICGLLLGTTCEREPADTQLSPFVYVYSDQDPDTLDAYKVTPMDTDSFYYDPEPEPLTPSALFRAEAMAELPFKHYVMGFDSVYFGEEVFETMLSTENVVGIRLYNAMESQTATSSSLIAIGVDSLRNEIYNEENRYIRSDGIVSGSGSTSALSREEALEQFEIAAAERVGFYVYFSKTTLMDLLKTEGAEGLYFIPGQRRFELAENGFDFTLIAAPGTPDGVLIEGMDRVMISDTGEVEEEDELDDDESGPIYLKSRMPCPPDCYPHDYFNPGG